jgi:ABC-type phosphate/phosphonate transport system ATPase subunit
LNFTTFTENNKLRTKAIVDMLEKEFKYYLDHQGELVKKYNNRFVAIADGKVVGDYDTFEQALFKTAEKYEPGTFLVQECTEGEEAYTQKFHSRVYFA